MACHHKQSARFRLRWRVSTAETWTSPMFGLMVSRRMERRPWRSSSLADGLAAACSWWWREQRHVLDARRRHHRHDHVNTRPSLFLLGSIQPRPFMTPISHLPGTPRVRLLAVQPQRQVPFDSRRVRFHGRRDVRCRVCSMESSARSI